MLTALISAIRARNATITRTRNGVADIGTFTPRKGFSYAMLNAALITGIIRALIVLIALETIAALISRPTRSSILYGV